MKESISEVYRTLFEAGILVLIVIVVFLQDWRATLVPATTVPVTIIGAFAAMAAMGFSINLLTLFAVVLAIGIVVDDAIVVVEGVAQHVERGQTPKQGAIDAMKELIGPDHRDHAGADVGVPAAGVHAGDHGPDVPAVRAGDRGDGADHRGQRADAEADAVRAVAAAEGPERGRRTSSSGGSTRCTSRVERWYVRLIRFMVERSGRMAAIALVLIGLAAWGLTRVPTGFIPTEDQGYLMVAVQMPDGASLERTQKVMDEIAQIGLADPGRRARDRDRHRRPLAARRRRLARQRRHRLPDAQGLERARQGRGPEGRSRQPRRASSPSVQEARTRVLVPPPIQGLGASNGFQMQVELTDGNYDFERLQRVTDEIVRRGQPHARRSRARSRPSARPCRR